MKRILKLSVTCLFAAVLYYGAPPVMASCSTVANSCNDLSDCTDPFPWPCDEACQSLCSAYVKTMECISGRCFCVCNTSIEG
jgi:hypothetical protein